MRTLTLLAAAFLVSALAVSPSAQAQETSLADRMPSKVPVVRHLQSSGVKLTYLGNTGGQDAYLGESANGRMQVFYVSPDGKHAIAGVMFRRDGTNVTGVQIGEMQKRFEQAQREIGAASVGGADGAPPQPTGSPGSPQAGTPEPTESAETPEATEVPSVSEDPAVSGASETSTAEPLAARLPVVSEDEAIVPNAGGADRWTGLVDQESFLAAVEDVAWFSVGDPSAPVIYKVADPLCPFCHQAWERLRPLVYNGEVQVRIIMIAGLRGSDPLARSILSRKDPGKAWVQGEGSVGGVPIQDPPVQGSQKWREAGQYLDINESFASKFKIHGTPFLAYVGADGRLYASSGMPDDAEAFFSALP